MTSRFRFAILCCGLAVAATAGTIAYRQWGKMFPSEDDLLLSEIDGQATPENLDELLEKTEMVAAQTRSWEPDQDALAENRLSRLEVAHVARHLRSEYPTVSLREKLAYEGNANRRKSKLNKESEQRLVIEEDPSSGGDFRMTDYNARVESLAMLHSKHVIRFITQDGFGFSRHRPPSITYLALDEVCAAPVDSRPPNVDPGPAVKLLSREPSYQEFAGTEWGSNVDDRVLPEFKSWADKRNPLRLPSRARLIDIHEQSKTSFSGPTRNGYVEDVDRVAGFASHAVAEKPAIKMNEPLQSPVFWEYEKQVIDGVEQRVPVGPKTRNSKPLWRLTRMQLISLLKHNKPRAYVSDNVPQMDELINAETRPLDQPESMLLDDLYAGEDIATQSHQNQILMLGSLRAQKHCTECHDASRGELLGAFSYELVRVAAR